MRTTLIAASLFALAVGCGNSGGGTGDDTTPGDDGTGDDGSGSDNNPPPPDRGFQMISPDVEIGAGVEDTYCWYFHTPNTEDMVIKKWSSSMTEGSHHMIVYLTTSDQKAPGTIDNDECGGFSISQGLPAWTYAAQSAEYELELPQDDGTGKPLGQLIPAGSSGYIQMHYLNASDNPVQAHVTLNAEAYAAGAAYTSTAPFITYQTSISVGPGATGVTVTKNAPVSADKKFWQLSTHAHKQAVNTQVKDGQNMLFDSDDWEHPGVKLWEANPFYQFTSGSMTWSCTYNNTGDNANRTVTQGASAARDEMCMATAYYFPATKATTCISAGGPSATCF